MDNNSFRIMLQAMLDKAKSIFNIKSDIKNIEPKLPKIKVQATLDSGKTKSELNAKLKSIRPKVKVDADTTQAVKKIKKLGQQKIKPTVQPTVDSSQVVSGLKEAQKQTKTLWDRFVSGAIGVNLVRMSVQKVTQAIYQAIVGIKKLDKIKTDIQTASGVDDSRINSMMKAYNQMAKDLSSTTKDVGNAANEIVRMGESLSDTNKLIENSTMLAKIGMIESSQATEYLISSMKGFQITAEDSMKIIDKLTSVDMQAAVSAGGLAEAISHCSSTANNSGTSMDRLIGYAAAIGEVTQESMSVVGNSMKTLYSRFSNLKVNRFIDDDSGESLSDVESVLNKLGIKLRETESTYRNFDDVLDDIARRWEGLTQVERNAVSVAMAGTYQRNRFLVLMDNYSNALKYSEVAANSAGNALERYGVYEDSIEAKTNELTAAIESLSMNTVSEELYSGIIQATTGLVEFLDKTNLLKGALSGLIAMGVSKAFVSISTGFIAAVKSTTQLSAAMALFDKGRSADNLRDIGAACKGLSNQQLKLVLSTKGLRTQQRLAILEGMGLEEQERQQILTTLGFANAENAATAATFSFKGALKALWTVAATNPLGVIFTAVTTLTMAFSWVKQKQEEATQAMDDAISEYESAKSSLESVNSELDEQNKQLDKLLAKDKLTYAEKGQLEELQAITQELLLQQDIEERRAANASKEVADKVVDAYEKQYGKYDKTEEDLQKKLSYDNFLLPESTDDVLGMIVAYTRAKELLEQSQKEFNDTVKNGEDTTWIAEDVQYNIDAVDDYRQALDENISDLQEKLLALENEYNKAIEKRESGAEPLTSSEKEYINTYESIYDTIKLIYEYTNPNKWNNMEISNIFNTKDIEKTKEELIELQKAGELSPEDLQSFPKLYEAIKQSEIIAGEGSNAVKEFYNEIVALADEQANVINDSIDTSTPFLAVNEMVDQLNTRLKPAFDKIGSAYQDIFTTDGFDLDAVDIPMLEDLRSTIEELNDTEGLNLNIDMGAFDDFSKILTDVNTTEEQAQQAFDDLATSIFYATSATEGMSEETVKLVEQLLESLGVTNAEEVALYALKEAKAQAILATYDLANAEENNFIAILNEGEAANLTRQEIYNLTAAEIAFGQNSLSAEQKIEQLKNLAKAYGDTASAALATAIANDLASGRTDVDTAINELMAKVNNGVKKVDLDFVSIPKSSSKSKEKKEKDTTKEFDWIEQAIENVKKEVKTLDDVVNSVYSTFSQKNEALAKEIGKVSEEIDLQQQAYAEYMRKADSIGLSDDYKTLVQSGAINIEEITDEKLQEQIDAYQKWYDKAQNASDAIKELKTDMKDLYVSAYELQTDNLKERLDSDSITQRQYLEGLKNAYELFYGNLEEYAQQYHEAVLEYLDEEKGYLNDVAGAAASLLDREIDNVRDDAEEQENRLKKQIDLLEDRKKPLEDELDALEDKAKREEQIFNLQKAQYNLAKAEHQRTKLVYTEDKGMIYTNDPQAIRDAQKDVDDAKLEIQKQSIQDQIDALDDEIDKYNDLIDQINKAADNQIDALEKIKNKWQEVIDQQEYAKDLSLLTGEFGTNSITKILTGNDDDLLTQWKNNYINTLSDIDMESQGYIGNMTQQIASLYGVDLSPLQSQFQGVEESVNGMTDALNTAANAVGIGNVQDTTSSTNQPATESSPAPSTGDSLENAIVRETETAMNSFDQHTDKLTNEVIPAIQSATEEMNTFNETADTDIEKVITIHYETTGGDISSESNKSKSSGNAHVEGTAKVTGDWSVQSNEKKALVGEIGRELVVRDGRFFTVGEKGAEMFDIKKGDIVFNNEQTEALLKNGHISGHGKAYADGTVGDPFASGRYVPIQPRDRAWDLQKSVEPLLKKMESDLGYLASNSRLEHGRQLDKMVNQITNASIITNNMRTMRPVINQNISVTLPNVTNSSCAEELLRDLQSISSKSYQYFNP